MAAGLARDIWQSLGNRAKAVLSVACIASCALFLFAGRWFGIPRHPGYEVSLTLQPAPATTLALVTVMVLLAAAVGTVIAGAIRFDAGLFAAAVGLATLSCRGGPIRYVTQAAPGHGVFLALAVELGLLGLMLGAAWLGLWLLFRGGHLAGDEIKDGLKDQPHSLADRATALALQAAGTAMLVILLARTDDKKQVLSAVAVASLLSSLLAYSIVPARPSVCFWAGPIIAGVVGYVAAYLSWGSVDPVTWKSGQGGGLFMPLARPLPLDYASLGTAGAILGYWTSRQWQRAKELETEAIQATAAPTH
jgi:hypothetical protein